MWSRTEAAEFSWRPPEIRNAATISPPAAVKVGEQLSLAFWASSCASAGRTSQLRRRPTLRLAAWATERTASKPESPRTAIARAAAPSRQ